MIANNGEFHKQYMVEKITASDGTVVYQHQAKPVRIFSPATATILQELLRGQFHLVQQPLSRAACLRLILT